MGGLISVIGELSEVNLVLSSLRENSVLGKGFSKRRGAWLIGVRCHILLSSNIPLPTHRTCRCQAISYLLEAYFRIHFSAFAAEFDCGSLIQNPSIRFSLPLSPSPSLPLPLPLPLQEPRACDMHPASLGAKREKAGQGQEDTKDTQEGKEQTPSAVHPASILPVRVSAVQ